MFLFLVEGSFFRRMRVLHFLMMGVTSMIMVIRARLKTPRQQDAHDTEDK
jgi:hypothetical protein